MTTFPTRTSLAVCLLVYLFGCAKTPYATLDPEQGKMVISRDEGEAQISRGEPITVLDGLGHYLISLPIKLILWNWKVDNHDISKQTEEVLVQYLQANRMEDVRVRLNEYSPLAEFSRLYQNSAVGAGWRATLGVFSVLFYAVLPGRLLGGDHYNPFTNTINLYSDHSAIALHEAGHAKDFMEKDWRGTYSFLGILPFSSLFFESEATADALGYLKNRQMCELQRDGYKILYPAYGTYIGGSFIDAVGPTKSFVGLLFVIPGHIAGRTYAADVNTDAPECIKTPLEPPPTEAEKAKEKEANERREKKRAEDLDAQFLPSS